jgi:hypothetical protein
LVEIKGHIQSSENKMEKHMERLMFTIEEFNFRGQEKDEENKKLMEQIDKINLKLDK